MSDRSEKLEADQHKAAGNKAFTEQRFDDAISEFSQAIDLDPSNHVYYSNRSGAYASLKQYDAALNDANKTIELSPQFIKGYSRKGHALYGLNRYEDAKKTYEDALRDVDPNSQALKDGLQDIEKHIQQQQQASSNPFAKLFGHDMITKLAADPSTKHLLSDPSFMAKIQRIRDNPNNVNNMLGDPQVMQAVSVLLGINMRTMNPNDKDGGMSAEGMADEYEFEQKVRT